MSNKTKKTNVKKNESKKIDISKINLNDMSNDERDFMINYYCDILRTSKIRAVKCRTRAKLRKYCNYYGGLRNRTYVDKTTNVKHNVEKHVEQSTTK